ncbi:MAG: hypothetical protein U0169_12325 [Polyangiaceae bacterium]
MEKKVVAGVGLSAAVALVAWKFVHWANENTLLAFNETDEDVSITLGDRTETLRARSMKDFGGIGRSVHLTARGADGVVDELEFAASDTSHFVYNVAGRGNVYVVDYTGLYECDDEGHEKKERPPIVVVAALEGERTYRYEGRTLLAGDAPLPETQIGCRWDIFRAEVVPKALVVGGDVVGYLSGRVATYDRFMPRFHGKR